MADVKKVIDEILSGVKFKNNAFFTDRVYSDMPILHTASQMSDYLPEPCRRMRELAKSPETLRHNEAWLFVRQGKLMEDYEDDCPFSGEFSRYFPTYQSMSNAQLRGYFTWRTAVRRGDIRKTSLSFVFVYLYELLNQIGVSSPEDGLAKLRSFWTAYRVIDPYIDRYMKIWLSDYCVYYNLPPDSLPAPSVPSPEAALSVLLCEESKTTAERFEAIRSLSSYNIEKSRFYREHEEDVQAITVRVWDRWAQKYEKRCKNTLIEHLFGHVCELSYSPFSSAVFYDSRRYEDYTYRKNDLCLYRCQNGFWSCRRLWGNLEKNAELGTVLHTVDRLLRDRFSYPAALTPRPLGKGMTDTVEKEIGAYLEEKKAKEKPVIELDLSRLAGIRRASDETREKLLVEEIEEEEEPFTLQEEEKPPVSPVSEEKKTPAPVSSEESSLPAPYSSLTKDELFLLRSLLQGAPYAEALREKGVLPSVLADGINEKLMDEFGDTVLVQENDLPTVLEDYRDELTERLSL